jgi:murein DD-endopeptidase MepM/ murein hydrolase activator NlpD
MPAHGQHRKSRPSRLVRLGVIAGTGSAALALPLVTATQSSAATPAQSAPAKSAPAAAHAPSTAHAAAAKSTSYVVKPGDSLSRIAAAHHVPGGWHRVYDDNRAVIGPNPDLIRPGQHLTLGTGTAHKAAPAKAKATTTKAKAAKAEPAAAKKAAAKKATASSSGYTKPVGNAAIGTGYRASGSLWSSGSHTGVDFLVGSGTPVHAVAAGTVVSAGADGAYGNDVIIKHADGKYTLYGHLSQPLVSAGQTVTEGQEIGISGATGNVTGPHLHFEVRTTPYYGSDIDPVAYLASHGVTI